MTEDYHPPTKSDLIEVIHTERTRLESLLEGLTDSQMTESGVESSWSIKDILAHIAAWERLAFDRIHAALSGKPLKFPLIKGDNCRLFFALCIRDKLYFHYLSPSN